MKSSSRNLRETSNTYRLHKFADPKGPFASVSTMTRPVAIFCLMYATLRADLSWTSKTVHVQIEPGQKQVVAQFGFENLGTQPVEFLEVTRDCDCVTPQTPRVPVPPGTKGILPVVFEVGDRTGTHEKRLVVRTKGDPSTATSLTLIVDIPKIVAVSPKVLVWKMGAEASERLVEISIQAGAQVTLLDVQSVDPDFRVVLEPGDATSAPRLRVAPLSTQSAKTTTLRLSYLYGSIPVIETVFAAVK
jgi:hypothetical protein